MHSEDSPGLNLCLALADPDATDALGQWLARHLGAGDVLLLSGPIGAGKSHLARAILRTLIRDRGLPPEDIPSPTYTLVQTYPLGDVEAWHADLYRLGGPDDVFELGLDAAFDEAICLVEWPDRLGESAPESALSIGLQTDPASDGRRVCLQATAPRWAELFADLSRPGCDQ